MKGLTKLHTREMGLCRLEDGTVALFAETKDEVYLYPMEKMQDSYLLELTQYLVLKYEGNTRKGFLEALQTQEVDVQRAFFDKRDNLLRDNVVKAVRHYLQDLDFPSADSI